MDDDPVAKQAPFLISLAVVHHAFLNAAECVFTDVPGGVRGYLVLGVCSHQSPPTQAACAHQLGIDRSVFTYLVEDLENDKLVVRTPDPLDRRARRISITAKGLRLLEKLTAQLAEAEKLAISGLNAAEQDDLRGLLWRAAEATTPDATTSSRLAEELARPRSTRRGRRSPS